MTDTPTPVGPAQSRLADIHGRFGQRLMDLRNADLQIEAAETALTGMRHNRDLIDAELRALTAMRDGASLQADAATEAAAAQARAALASVAATAAKPDKAPDPAAPALAPAPGAEPGSAVEASVAGQDPGAGIDDLQPLPCNRS